MLDTDPVFPESFDPDPVCPERLDPVPVCVSVSLSLSISSLFCLPLLQWIKMKNKIYLKVFQIDIYFYTVTEWKRKKKFALEQAQYYKLVTKLVKVVKRSVEVIYMYMYIYLERERERE